MTARPRRSLSLRRVGYALALLLGVPVLGSLAIYFATGRGVGVRSFPRAFPSLLRAMSNRNQVRELSHGNFTNILFLHHSTGERLIRQGRLRGLFTEAGYAFWDHGFNSDGLRDPAGAYAGYEYLVPGDNTDPDGLAAIFSQPEYSIPADTFTALLQHEVIILKSCFLPGNDIRSDGQLESY